MAIKFQVKRANTAIWSSTNPVLDAGEIGFESDTNKLKIGNGSNTWANLTYIASGINVYDSVSAVNSAVIGSNINHIRTAGYHSNGDGGAALYKRVTSGATGIGTGRITSNGGTVIWELAEKEINVRQFGAYGNYPTNDDATAINNAIAWLGNAGGTLTFPPGNYRVDSTVTANVPVMLRGTGTSGSVYQPVQNSSATITWAGAVGGDVVRFGGFGTLISGGGIIDLKIDGIASASWGLRIKDVQRAYFRGVTITGASAGGLLMENTSNGLGTFDPTGFCVFDDLRIMLRGGATNNARGIYINGSGVPGTPEGVTLCTFRRCRIDHADGPAVEIGDTGDFFYWESLMTFRADNVETGSGVWFSSTSPAATCGGHQFYGCNISAGYRFELPNIHYQTRIINTGHIDVNANSVQLFGRGSGDVSMITALGFGYGQALLEPRVVYKRRDNCALIRYDANNSILHTADGNWKANVTSGGTITENQQAGSGLDLSTASTANSIVSFYDNATIGGGNGFSPAYSIAGSFLVAPVSNSNTVMRFGWADSVNITPTNGIYVEYDPSVNNNFRLVCTKNGNTSSSISPGGPNVGAKQEVYIYVEPDSRSATAYFRADQNKLFLLIGSLTSNVPTVSMSTICYIRTKEAAAKRVDIYGVKVGAVDEVYAG